MMHHKFVVGHGIHLLMFIYYQLPTQYFMFLLVLGVVADPILLLWHYCCWFSGQPILFSDQPIYILSSILASTVGLILLHNLLGSSFICSTILPLVQSQIMQGRSLFFRLFVIVQINGFQEVLVRFAGFGNEEDEWVNVRKHVRQRSLPCESSECIVVLPGDLILCFQVGG